MSPQTVEIAMRDLSLDTLFDDAIEAIQSTISEEERRTFRHHAGISSLVEDLRSICASNQKEYQRLVGCSKKITLFSRTFAPYFDVVGMFGQVRPDWLGWFWGSVRLVFKVGSNYVQFLEKITDMFKVIAHGLPQYRQFHDSYRHQFQERQDDRLRSLMSSVYADIIQFCLELYCMFSRGSQGAKLRHLSVLWRPLDSRFAQLQQRLAQHKKWFEAEKEIHDLGLLAHRRKEYIDFLNTRVEANSEVEAERMARRLRRIDKIKAWLQNCCAYRDVYEYRTRQRHPNSCAWFLDTAAYCKWKNTPFDQREANDTDSLNANWHDRVLFVQAKSGFGKTFLSGQVIDDLSTKAKVNISDDPPTTAFFHFNAAHLYCTHPNDAFRALAFQLIHTHQHDRVTLDALSLLMRQTSAQAKASSDDVLAVLSLLLRQHSTFLVIDGVDECSDIELFLRLIPELCRKSDTRVILFSRPTIKIPLDYQKWASDCPHIISLNEAQNAADIESYVTENLNRMADQGFFGICMDRSLIPQVAGRSNGMFLWASLLLKYLKSPGLSPNERRTILEEAHLLEGLEALYRSIFNMLDRSSGREKRVAVDTFRWLSLSIRRLCIPGLQRALAITPGQPTTEDQYLSNFAESIPHLTCGLVEVTNCSVLFTHRSVKEYLQSSECQDSDFSLFDESTVHSHLAARCISFLANDVPKRPLQRLQPYIKPTAPLVTSSGTPFRISRSGDSGYKSMSSASDTDGVAIDNPQSPCTAFDTNMPFLRYAALCWPIHLTRALANAAPRPHSAYSDPFLHTPWLPVLSHFLTERPAVTSWVEASWRYNLPPNISRLVPLLLTIKHEIPPATIEGRELRWVVHGLRQLNDALSELKGNYGTTLRENPSLIWQWNIQAATEGGFWPVWDEMRGRVHGV